MKGSRWVGPILGVAEATPYERQWLCANCGHGWLWHSDFDESCERFVDHACEYWEGCRCRGFVEATPTDSSGGQR